MSAAENRMRNASLAALLANSAAGIGAGGPMGSWASNVAGMNSNIAQSLAAEEAAKEEKKKKKAGGLGKIGGILGGIAGSFIPGVGPIIGPAIGSALGGTAGQLAGGAKPDLGTALGYGAQGAIGGVAGQVMSPIAKVGAGAAQAGTQAAGGAGAGGAGAIQGMAQNALPGAVGQNTVLAPTSPIVPAAGSLQAGQAAKGVSTGGGLLSGWAQDPRLKQAFVGQMFGQGVSQGPAVQAPRKKYIPGYGFVDDYGYAQDQVG